MSYSDNVRTAGTPGAAVRPGAWRALRRGTRAAVAVASLAVMLAAATGVQAAGITLPPDAVQLTPSDLPGYDKARSGCAVCHSAEYMVYQPASAPRAYWRAMVDRMRTVFKAPVPEQDVDDIVDYLVRTYGNEQPGARPAKQPAGH